MTKRFVLVDGSSYLYRAYHALPPLTSSSGEPTGAIYGVVNMLKRLLKDENPEHIAVIFDAKGKTFRDAIYPEYKANRPPMPDDLRPQIEPLQAIVKAMGLPLLVIEGVEADDVIGTLAKQAEDHDLPVLISTGDKDMAQLVNPHVELINTMNNKRTDEKGVVEKFGVRADQFIDYLTLVGDSADNIPGVPKVGPKTAAKWLNEYGTLDNIVANADQFKGKIGENLRNALGTLPLSKELVTIKCDVELPYTPETLNRGEPDHGTLRDLFRKLSFKKWENEVEEEDVPPPDEAGPEREATQYQCITNEQILEKWVDAIRAEKLLCVDTETNSLDVRSARVVGLSLSIAAGHAAYVPFGHDYEDAPKQLTEEIVWKYLKPILEDENIKKIGQNLKYDINVLRNHDIDVRGVAYDTMLESYMNNSTAHRHDLNTLADVYCQHKMITFSDVAGKGKKQITFNQVELDKAAEYAAEDADYTLRVHQALMPQLQEKPGPLDLFTTLEMPLVRVLADMEYYGVLIDADVLAEQSVALQKRIDKVQGKIFKETGENFNIDSPKQLQQILFDKMGLPAVSKTPTGQPSTSEPVLQELAANYDIPAWILEYRSLSKLKSTYTDKLPRQVKDATGRVHTSYNQTVTATGRLSSSDPNLQNIPIRTDAGRAIRKAFIAPKGYKIVAIDYSQIELRIMAHLSGDKNLQAAFHDDQDIHRATAAEVFGIAIDAVTSEQRRRAKAINFGLIYGMSAFGLAKQIGSSREEAQQYIDIYFDRYPGVKAYMDNTRKQAAKLGYVETLRGRRLYLPDINAGNHMRKMAAERTAINAPMQGTAADIIKQAMLDVDAWLKSTKADAKMVMQVHDELVFEVKADEAETITAKLEQLMDDAYKLNVPVKAEAGIGDNWDEAH
jgi:DNA polymerase-1